jgi:hypothetical protein
VVRVNRRFGGTCRLHLQYRKINQLQILTTLCSRGGNVSVGPYCGSEFVGAAILDAGRRVNTVGRREWSLRLYTVVGDSHRTGRLFDGSASLWSTVQHKSIDCTLSVHISSAVGTVAVSRPLFRTPPLWSSGQSFWPQIQRTRVRFPALPDILRSSGSGTEELLGRNSSGSGQENRD